MPRLKWVKRLELECFWREHLKAWRDSDLNQREYCERHGLALKRFGNWRAKFKDKETFVPQNLLWRRGGGDRTSASARSREIPFTPVRKRRNYSDEDKRRLIEEATRENASVSGVARKYGISTDLMFRWRKQLGMGPMHRIVPVTIADTPDGLADLSAMMAQPTKQAAPVIVDRTTVDRPSPAIEVELAGGRRLRFEQGTDPATIERLVSLLEGASR
jgi:transposase-like protein